jgi:hypothetical protein
MTQFTAYRAHLLSLSNFPAFKHHIVNYVAATPVMANRSPAGLADHLRPHTASVSSETHQQSFAGAAAHHAGPLTLAAPPAHRPTARHLQHRRYTGLLYNIPNNRANAVGQFHRSTGCWFWRSLFNLTRLLYRLQYLLPPLYIITTAQHQLKVNTAVRYHINITCYSIILHTVFW